MNTFKTNQLLNQYHIKQNIKIKCNRKSRKYIDIYTKLIFKF